MTALNAYRLKDKVVLHSDVAIYDETGRVVQASPKVCTFPHIGVAIGVRGAKFAYAHLAPTFAAMFGSIDEMRDHRPLQAMVPILRENLELMRAPTLFEFLVVGWSPEKDGPDSFMLSSIPDGELAYTLTEIEAFTAAPSPDFAAMLTACRPELRQAAESPDELMTIFDPDIDGLMILDNQRRLTFEFVPGGEKFHGVGIAALSTTVTRDAIEQRVIRRWPDRIGARITPAANVA
jgi:hypothetical protein